MPLKTPPTTLPGQAEAIAFKEIRATRMPAAVRGLLPAVFLLLVTSVLVLLTAGQAAAPLPGPLQAGFEDALEKASPWRSLALDAAWTLLRPLGASAEEAFQGHDGWLFYRPDVEHLTGPAFDPVPPLDAIAQLHLRLQTRGIQLIVFPVPIKPSIYPEKLSLSATSETLPRPRRQPDPSSSYQDGDGGAAIIRSPSYARFVEGLRSRGVRVVDIGPSLMEGQRLSEKPLYLATDTHWSPDGLEAASRRLATEVAGLLGHGALRFQRAPLQVAAQGDTARLLHLDSQVLSGLETVTIQQVFDSQGHLWRPQPSAPVLLLGDSFSNTYTLADMGFGTSAGLAAQLSFHTGHPVDTLVQNDQAATAPGRLLTMLSSNRLAPETRLVVYQFAARELSFGDWVLQAESEKNEGLGRIRQ